MRQPDLRLSPNLLWKHCTQALNTASYSCDQVWKLRFWLGVVSSPTLVFFTTAASSSPNPLILATTQKVEVCCLCAANIIHKLSSHKSHLAHHWLGVVSSPTLSQNSYTKLKLGLWENQGSDQSQTFTASILHSSWSQPWIVVTKSENWDFDWE